MADGGFDMKPATGTDAAKDHEHGGAAAQSSACDGSSRVTQMSFDEELRSADELRARRDLRRDSILPDDVFLLDLRFPDRF